MTAKRPSETRLLRRLVVSLVVLALILVLALRAMSPRTSGEEIGVDEALRLAAARQVTEATFKDHDARAVLTVAGSDERRWAAYPTSGSDASPLITAMVQGGAKVHVDQQWGKQTLAILAQFILPLLLLANIFGIFILMARGGGGSQVRELFAFSRIRPRRSTGQASEITFEDVGAAEESVAELAEVRDYLEDPTRFAAMGALPPKGVLLYGPPGCGKTLLARALAGEAKVPFFFISGSEFVESLVGVGAARVRDLFRQAKASAPAIVFVDELDAAGRKRGAGIGGGHDEREQTLNELLVQMDGFSPTSGVVVIAATNRPDILDPALLRPGRFDRHVGVDMPDLAGRIEILELHAESRRLEEGVDLEAVARLTPGFTGADLANVLNEAALLAVRRRATAVSTGDLAEAVDRVMAGPRRRGRVLEADELSRLAYHEAGHVVVARALEFPAAVHRVSIVSRGRNAAHAAMRRADRTVLGRGELLAELAVVMGGVVAEELLAGEPSTAGESDIERASDLARRIVGTYGMSEQVGRVRLLQADGEVFLGRDYMAARNVSSDTLALADEAVRVLIDGAEATARRMLQTQRRVLDSVAKALVERETLDENDLKKLLTGGSARAKPKRLAKQRA